MAGASKQPESTVDGLRSIAGEIFNLTMHPDSMPHMQFLQSLVQGIQQYIVKNAMQATNTPMGGGQGGGPQGGPQQSPGAPPQGPPRPMGGAMQSPGGPAGGMPNPDELRRLLGAGAPVA